jgi:diguanylate cyclase (GGDEF)-like protein/PAS domain S-box-containing protein
MATADLTPGADRVTDEQPSQSSERLRPLAALDARVRGIAGTSPTYGPGTRFTAWVLGAIQFLVGLTMIVAPAQFDGPAYDALRGHLTILGMGLVIAGLLLFVWQVLALDRTRLPQLSLLFAGAVFVLMSGGFLSAHIWTLSWMYGLFAFTLAFAAFGGESWLAAHHIDIFMLMVAVDRTFLGLFLALLRTRLNSAPYQFIQPFAAVWSLNMFFAAALLLIWQRRKDRLSHLALPLFAAMPMLAWTYEVGVRSNLVASVIANGLLTGGVLARVFIPDRFLSAPRDRLVNKMVAASAVALGAAVIVLVVALLHQTEAAYIQRTALDMNATGDVVSHASSEFIRTNVIKTRLLSKDPEVTGWDPDQQLAFVARVVNSDPDIIQISIENKDGITVVRSTGEQPNVDRRGVLPGVAKIFADHQPNWDVTLSLTQRVPVVSLREPILADDGSFNGAFIVQVPLTSLTRQLAQLPLDPKGRIVIVDDHGLVLAHPNPDVVLNRQDLSGSPPVRAAMDGKSGPVIYRDGGQQWMSVPVRVQDLGWTVLVEQPQASVLAPSNRAREQALVLLAAALVLLTWLAIIFARGFSRPVLDLARAARSFGGGGDEPSLPPAGGDEVGDLVHAFRDMVARLAARTQERDRVEETLRDSEERYRGIVETAQEGIWLLDAGFKTTFVNARMAEILGTTVQDLDRESLFTFVDPADVSDTEAKLVQWRQGNGEHQEFRLLRVDGNEIWVLISAHTHLNESGEYLGAMAMVTDVTARKRGEEERAVLLENEQLAREEVEALLAATESLGVQADSDEVMRTLVVQAAGLLDVESAAYAIGESDHLQVHRRWMDGKWIEESYELPVVGSIFGRAWTTGQPYRSNDLKADPFVSVVRVTETGNRSMIAAPLLAPNGERLGCVAAWNSRRPGGFSERDERLLAGICETGAAVLMRARDLEARLDAERAAARRKEEVEALLSAADRLNSAVDPEEVLLSVVGVAAELLSVSRVGIATNEGDYVLRRHTWLNGSWHAMETRIPWESMSGWVIQNARPYRSNDFAHDSLSFPVAQFGTPAQRALSVPILGRTGHVLGALNIFDRTDGQDFTDDDQRLAEGIAHHAAVALERAGLTAELRRSQEQLKIQAFSDALTGLPNRPLFMDRLAHALTLSRRRSGGVAVLFLDLDGFKLVNDSMGHAAGDELLIAIAERLSQSQRPEDTVSRFGGDEFAVLLENVASSAEALDVAGKIIAEMRRPFRMRRREIVITSSIGIAFNGDSTGRARAEDLLREADIALYQAKAGGKARAVVFDPTMSAQAVERLDLETSLRRAVDRGELIVYYQPIVELATGAIVGAEALVRWQHPLRGLLEPDSFIPLAEETGLILPAGSWVLDQACAQARAWQTQSGGDLPIRMSVNLSARQFEQADLVEQVTAALRRSGLPPECLELEITETTVIQNAEGTIAMIQALKDLGVRLAIDDFGTGYSSLSYLRRLSVDTLKVDRSFMVGLRRDHSTAAIIQAIISMAHALKIDVTAEGIETEDQLELVRHLGCDYGQGYHLARPMPGQELAQLMVGLPV